MVGGRLSGLSFSPTPKTRSKDSQPGWLARNDDGEKPDLGYRVDPLVGDQVVVEIKSVEAIPPVSSRIAAFLHAAGRQERRSSE
jgi:hypothetical protein